MPSEYVPEKARVSAAGQRNAFRKVLFVSATVTVLATPWFWLWATRASQGMTETIGVTESDLALGTLWATSEYEHSVEVRNQTTDVVHLDRIQASCGCSKISPERLSLKPGERKTLQLILDLNSGAMHSEPVSEFQVNLSAIVRGARTHRATWPIRGTIQKAVRIPVGGIKFIGAEEVISQKGAEGSIRIYSLRKLEGLRIYADDSLGETSLQEVEPGVYTLTLTLPPLLPVGDFSGGIEVAPVLRGGQELPRLHIPVTGRVSPDVIALPEQLILPPAPVGAPVQRALALRSRAKKPFVVQAIESTGSAALIASHHDSAPRAEQQIELTVSTDGLGPNDGMLSLTLVYSEGGRPPTVNVPVSGYGLATEHDAR